MSFQLSTDHTTIVDPNYFWIPRVEATPSAGSKVQLINRPAGCATHGNWSHRDDFWTHWAPLPKFRPDGVVFKIEPTLPVKHRAVKADIKVNSGALLLALNSLKRGTVSQREIAVELELTIETL